MAVSKIWAIHTNTGDTLNYIAKYEKSDNGALVFSHNCSNIPELANIQMRVHRSRFGKNSDILLHHGFVSFKRDEVDRETAYRFAKIFMERHFSEHQYFGSVHVDTEHIHFNFAINAVALDGHKYNGCTKTLLEMRAEVDRCCEEMGLSVVIPKGLGTSYKERMEQEKNNSWKSQIKVDIDMAIAKANSFEEFLHILKDDGYFIKQGDNVKHMVVRKEGMEKGCRTRKLGIDYTEEAIKDRIQFKDVDYIRIKAELRKPNKMKPIEKELMRIFYRKPSVSTNLAMGIHLLNSYVTGERHKIVRYSAHKKKRIQSIYDKEIKKISAQIIFCYENHIKTRSDLYELVDQLKSKLELEIEAEGKAALKKAIKSCDEIDKTLNEIRDRDIINNFDEKIEKDKTVVELKKEEKER